MVRFRPVVAEVPLPLLLQPARARARAAHVAAATSTRVDRLPCRFIAFLSLSAAHPMGGGRGAIQMSIRIVDTYRFDAFVCLRQCCSQVVGAARRRMVQTPVSQSGRSPLSGAESAEAESDPWPAAPVSPWAPVARTGSASPAARCRAVRTTDS